MNNQQSWGICRLKTTYGLFLNSRLLFIWRSKPDICEGGTEALWLRLTTQWGADESVPTKQAIPKPTPAPPYTVSPSLTCCTDFRKKYSGGFQPPHPPPRKKLPTRTATCPPKSTFGKAAGWRAFSLATALRSCRAVTVTGRTVPPHKRTDNHHSGPLIGPVWTERTLMGQSRVVVVAREGASLHREVSVSWETTLIVCPCPEFPIPPHPQPPLSVFFPPLHWLFTRLLPA